MKEKKKRHACTTRRRLRLGLGIAQSESRGSLALAQAVAAHSKSCARQGGVFFSTVRLATPIPRFWHDEHTSSWPVGRH